MQLADVHRFLLNLRVVWVKNTAFWPDCKAAGSKIPLFSAIDVGLSRV